MGLKTHKQNYYPDIQVLRGLAVVSVLLFHFYPKLFPGGYVGVDIFFVISGYLVGGSVFSSIVYNRFNFKDFMFKRFARLFPAFLVMILLSISISIGTTLAFKKSFGVDVLATLANVSNIRFYRSIDYFNSNSNILLHTWSLSAEWQFYTILPIFLLVMRKISKSYKILRVSIFALLFISFLGFITAQDHKQAIFYLIPFRLWEFIIGVLIFGKTYSFKFHYIILLLLFSIIIYADLNSIVPNVLTVMCTSFYLLNSLNQDPKKILMKNTVGKAMLTVYNLFEHFGKISYSVYLYHYPLAILFVYLFTESYGKFNHFLYFAILYLVSVFSYAQIESRKTLLNYKSKILKFTVVSTMLIISCQAYFIFQFGKLLYVPTEYNISKLYRTGKCFIEKLPDESVYDECVSYKSHIIWGDSHAASIYSGLENYPLSQVTASNCPPFLNKSMNITADCLKVNSYAIDFIKSNEPDSVILAANWVNYGSISDISESLINTITVIKRYCPDTTIIVIGNFPHWVLPLQSQLNRTLFYNNINVDSLIDRSNSKYSVNNTVYLKNHSALKLKSFDDSLKSKVVSNTQSIFFVSPIDFLCIYDECIAMLKDSEINNRIILSSFDKNHLTPEMARILIKNSKLMDYIILPDTI